MVRNDIQVDVSDPVSLCHPVTSPCSRLSVCNDTRGKSPHAVLSTHGEGVCDGIVTHGRLGFSRTQDKNVGRNGPTCCLFKEPSFLVGWVAEGDGVCLALEFHLSM